MGRAQHVPGVYLTACRQCAAPPSVPAAAGTLGRGACAACRAVCVEHVPPPPRSKTRRALPARPWLRLAKASGASDSPERDLLDAHRVAPDKDHVPDVVGVLPEQEQHALKGHPGANTTTPQRKETCRREGKRVCVCVWCCGGVCFLTLCVCVGGGRRRPPARVARATVGSQHGTGAACLLHCKGSLAMRTCDVSSLLPHRAQRA